MLALVVVGLLVGVVLWSSWAPRRGTASPPRAAPQPREVAAAPQEPAAGAPDVRAPVETPEPELEAQQVEPPDPEPAPPASPAPIRLVLRDALRGEPVEDFAIELRRDGELLEALSSDAAGAVVTRDDHASGTYALHLLESPLVPAAMAPVVEWDFDASAAEVEDVTVRVGPTYVLRSIAPADVRAEDLTFSLRAASDPRSTLPEPWTRARAHTDAAEPWVRVPLLAVERVSGSGAWTLEVATDDHSAFGSVAVASAAEGHVERVDVRLGSGLTLTGFVREGDGSVVPGATLALYPDGWHVGEETWQTVSGEDGSYALHGLRAGGHKVLLSSERHSLVKARVVLEARSEVQHDFVLDATPLGVVRGVLRDFDQDSGQPTSLVLRSKTTPGVAFTRTPSPERDASGAHVGVFSFGEVPIDDYELSIDAPVAGSYAPTSIELRPPRTDLVFTRVHLGPSEDLGFLVVDARTREPLDGFDVVLVEDGTSTRSYRSVQNGAVVLPGRPSSRPFEWTLAKQGYQPAHGDARAFTRRDPVVERADGERRTAAGLFAEVALEPGWGVELLVRSPEGALADAVVLLDGLEAARTDVSGRARVASSVEPREIEVRHPDWLPRSYSGSTLSESPARTEGAAFEVLLSERAP